MGISICLLSLGSRMSGCPPCLGVIQEPEKDTEQGSGEPDQGRVLTSCFQAVHSGPSHLTSGCQYPQVLQFIQHSQGDQGIKMYLSSAVTERQHCPCSPTPNTASEAPCVFFIWASYVLITHERCGGKPAFPPYHYVFL